LLPVAFGALVFKLSVWCRAEGYAAAARKPDTQIGPCFLSFVND
jgi:hypothetical protein